MNNLQKKEFELLRQFIDICDSLDLKYFLVCGSALGAVKYKGFIPWDDDIDVGMFRDDFEIFIKKAPDLLKDNMFLQTFKTDPQYPNIFAKLRNSNTTYIESSVEHISMNHGVYIDIFPLDGYPKEIREQECLERRKKVCKIILSSTYNVQRSIKGKIAVSLMRLLRLHKKSSFFLQKYNDLISKYSVHDSDIVCNHGNWQGKLEYASKAQYGKGKWTTFEGISVRIPEKYDEYLTQKYGDWRAELPEEKQVGHHYYSVMDLEKTYTEYVTHNAK